MNKVLCFLCCTVLCTALCGCAPREQRPSPVVDLDEYRFQQMLDQCHKRVRSLMHDAPELVRRTHFDQCMEEKGYARETYKHLWIDI